MIAKRAGSANWLYLAGAVLLIEAVAVVVIVDPSFLVSISVIGITAVLVAALLAGSRIAWALLLAGAVSLLVGPFVIDQPVWSLVTGAVVVACLLARESRRFVWKSKDDRADAIHVLDWIYQLQSFWTSRLDWRLFPLSAGAQERLHRALFVLGFGTLLATPVVSRLADFHDGSGQGNPFVDVAWAITLISYTLARIAVVLAAIVAVINLVTKRGSPSV